MMIALPDATQCVRLEYKHPPLASHTTIGSLPDKAWLFASYSTSNSFGGGVHWTLNRDIVKAVALCPFRAPCEKYQGPLSHDQMEQWARPRRQVDALVLLPCGRAGVVDFGGEDRPIEWLCRYSIKNSVLNSCPIHRGSCQFVGAGDTGLSCQLGRSSSANPTFGTP